MTPQEKRIKELEIKIEAVIRWIEDFKLLNENTYVSK